MTDSDDKLLHRYRSLAREEPPRALDDAILAASRRAVARPSLSRRWAGPVSIAAVLVLAFGVTLEMQREEPSVAYPEPTKPERRPPAALPVEAPLPAAPVAAPVPAVRGEASAPAPIAPAELRKATPQMARKSAPTAKEPQRVQESFSTSATPSDKVPNANALPFPAAPADKLRDANVSPVPGAPASAPAPAAMAAPRAKAETADAAQAPARTLTSQPEPERELERIARLRDEGRNEEADKALDDFKRKYPGFRIPEATWPRVRPR